MERIRKGSDLPKKKWGYRTSNKNIRRSSYRKGHQLYIFLSFDSMRALEIHDVARATSCIACVLVMRSSNGRERPQRFPKNEIQCICHNVAVMMLPHTGWNAELNFQVSLFNELGVEISIA